MSDQCFGRVAAKNRQRLITEGTVSLLFFFSLLFFSPSSESVGVREQKKKEAVCHIPFLFLSFSVIFLTLLIPSLERSPSCFCRCQPRNPSQRETGKSERSEGWKQKKCELFSFFFLSSSNPKVVKRTVHLTTNSTTTGWSVCPVEVHVTSQLWNHVPCHPGVHPEPDDDG